MKTCLCAAALSLLLSASALGAPGVLSARVTPGADGREEIRWVKEKPDLPVSLYASPRPDDLSAARLIARQIAEDSFTVPAAANGAPAYYYAVGDAGEAAPGPEGVWASRRLIQLEKSSNLRDLGGYRTVDGKLVKWGRVFRSGAPVMLTPADLAVMDSLNIATTVDLRSREEQRIIPSQLADANKRRVVQSDYSLQKLMQAMPANTPGVIKSAAYHAVLTELAPLFRQTFTELGAPEGAVLYHCSAGQDRTGIMSALLLAALGVPRATILADYHLSTPSRRPQHEMPRIDLAKHPGDPVAAFFAGLQKRESKEAAPLYDDEGVSLLASAFDYIDQTWGSTENYLRLVIGLTDADFTRLRAAYLE